MLIRTTAFISTVLIASFSASGVVAQNPGKDLLNGIFNALGQQLQQELNRGANSFGPSNNQSTGYPTGSFPQGGNDPRYGAKTGNPAPQTKNGYCQLWRSGNLSVQEECVLKFECRGTQCFHDFYWPKGIVTKLFTENGRPVAINGAPAQRARIGADNCYGEVTGDNVFCFTSVAQRSNSSTAASGGMVPGGSPTFGGSFPSDQGSSSEFSVGPEQSTDFSAEMKEYDGGPGKPAAIYRVK